MPARIWLDRLRRSAHFAIVSWLACQALGLPTIAWGAELSKAQKAQLTKESNALWQAALDAKAPGQFDTALRHLEDVTDRERQLGNDASDAALMTLDEVAEVQQLRRDFVAAKAKRQAALSLATKLHGADSWQTTDARLGLELAETLAKLRPSDLEKLAEAASLLARIQALNRKERYAEAIPLAEQLVAIRSETLGASNYQTANAQHWLGHLLQGKHDHERAKVVFRECLETRQRMLGHKHPVTATSLANLASSLNELQDYAGAKPLYEQALAIRMEVLGPQHIDTNITLNSLALVLVSLEEYAGAKTLYEQALAMCRGLYGEKHRHTATVLNNLGRMLEQSGDYVGARAALKQSLAIRQEVCGAKHLDTAASLKDLAALYMTMGELATAKTQIEESLAIRQKVLGAQHPDTASTLNSLAVVLVLMGDTAGAKAAFAQSLTVHQALLSQRRPETAALLNNTAHLLSSTGDYGRAKPLYEQALALREEIHGEKHPATAAVLDNFASLLMDMDDFAGAKLHYERALAIRREVFGEQHVDTATSLNNLAKVLELTGDDASARRLYEQSLATKQEVLGEQHPATAGPLSRLGALLLKLNDPAGAEPYLLQAAEIALRRFDETAVVQSERQQLIMNSTVQGELDQCFELAQQRGAAVERVYGLALAWKGSVFVRQHQMHLAAARPELAETFAEWQSVSQRLATLSIATPPSAERAQWRADIAALAARKERLEVDLGRRSGEFRERQARVTPAQLSASLPAQAALVDIYRCRHRVPLEPGQVGRGKVERRMVAFVVRPDREVKMISLGSEDAIVDGIRLWLAAMERGQSGPLALAGDRLRQLLWLPLAAELTGVELLLVSPDGALSQFPWGALPGAKPDGYLLEDVSIAVIPVPRLLPAMSHAERERGDNSLLLVGEVDYAGTAGTQLADSRSAVGIERAGRRSAFADISTNTLAEIATIRDSFAERFPEARVEQLRRQQATETAFRQAAGQARWLHLATHGYFAPDSVSPPGEAATSWSDLQTLEFQAAPPINPGLLCGLALTGANNPASIDQDDGILTAVEVMALDLSRVELAVLSACQTGLGKVAGGEGLLGLQRAFQVSGAKVTVASVWKVPDRATAQLMTRFYANLWDKRLTRIAALREAQLWVLREGSSHGVDRGFDIDDEPPAKPADSNDRRLSPKFWAAFVLSGDWR